METTEVKGDAKKLSLLEKLCWLCSLGLKICQLVDLDDENSNLMSVSSESLILDFFDFEIDVDVDKSGRWNAGEASK